MLNFKNHFHLYMPYLMVGLLLIGKFLVLLLAHQSLVVFHAILGELDLSNPATSGPRVLWCLVDCSRFLIEGVVDLSDLA